MREATTDPLGLQEFETSLRWDPAAALPAWLDGTDLPEAPQSLAADAETSTANDDTLFVADETLVLPDGLPCTAPASDPVPANPVEVRPEAITCGSTESKPHAGPDFSEPPLDPRVPEASESPAASSDTTRESYSGFASIDDLARCVETGPEEAQQARSDATSADRTLATLKTASDALEVMGDLSQLIRQVARTLPSYATTSPLPQSSLSEASTMTIVPSTPEVGRRVPSPEELSDSRFCLVLEVAGRRLAIPMHAIVRTGNASISDEDHVDLFEQIEGRARLRGPRRLPLVEVLDTEGRAHRLIVDRILGPRTREWQIVTDAKSPGWILANALEGDDQTDLFDLATLIHASVQG